MKAIVLLSGGLDSVVALARALQSTPVVLALTVDYGQRAAARECLAAQSVAAHYGIPHQTVALPWLAELLPAALTPGATADVDADVMAVDHVWVPNRNGLFLNIAAAYAEAHGAEAVIFGANLEEGADFPDNTPEFRVAIEKSLAYSTLNRVQVLAPVESWDKVRIVAEGVVLKAPLQHVWSCYEGTELHCGACASCLRLKAALRQNARSGAPLPVAFAH